MNATHYDVLGVPHDASADDIKRAYRAFSRRNHPDIAGPEASHLFAAGTEAFTILNDPERRAQYDTELAAPPTPAEPEPPLDDWGQDEEWEDEEVLDAPIEDAPPTPQPAPSGGRDHAAARPEQEQPATGATRPVTPDELTIVDDLPDVRALTVAGLTAILIAAAWPNGVTTLRYAAAVAAATVLLTATLMWWTARENTKPSKRKPRQPRDKVRRPLIATTLTATVVIAMITAATLVALNVTTHNPNLWWAATMPAAAASTALVYTTITRLRARTRVFSKQTLRDYIIFGNPPPGEVPALLNRTLAPFVHSRADVRTIQQPHPALYYSHALICGEKVIYLKAIGTGPGNYFWSGTSLLRDDSDNLVTSLIGDYAGATRRIREDFTARGLEADAYIVVLKNPRDPRPITSLPPTGDNPHVIADTELHRILAEQFGPEPHLSRNACVEALREFDRFGNVRDHV